jgi:ABC-type glycerol-3-phosphate transport system permease component
MIKIQSLLRKFELLLLYGFLVLMVLITLLPLNWAFSTSIKPTNEIFLKPPRWIPQQPVLSSYIKVLTESSIPRACLNSFITGLLAMFISLVVGGMAGYAFARYRFRGSRFFSMFVLLSQMFPLTVLMIPLFYMEDILGLVDTRIGLALAHLAICLPLVIWMCKGYFKGIPKEIEEAAIIDGCNPVQTFCDVLLPLLRPAIAATGIYAFVSSWNEFTLANVLTRTDKSRTIPIALNEFSSFFKVDWGDTMAAAIIITVPILILFFVIGKEFIEGLASGAIKG